MQNCLQKNKSKSKMTKVVITVLAVLVIAAIVSLKDVLKGLNAQTVGVQTANAVTLFESLDKVSSHDLHAATEIDDKMNNCEEENAKSASFLPDSGKNARLSCKNVDVLMPDGKVETMALEEYVKGCVLGEMPLDFASQALMAQSVAIRTFTVRQILCGTSKHKNADVCTNSACCQSFSDSEKLNLGDDKRKKLVDAVKATEGIVMMYDGYPIEAVYHASSGERTLDSEEVWGGKREYLRSVPSPEGEAQMTSVLYGHRVGMSQHGANILAKRGYGYARILNYYYSGISFSII